MLEFGRGYIRFIRDGVRIFAAETRTITNITQANPAVVTYTGDTIIFDHEVFITDVSGMTEVNNRSFKVAGVGSGTIDLDDPYSGASIDSTGFTSYTSGGTIQLIYEVVTPYAAADVMNLKFSQNADEIIITHPDYSTRKLIRSDHNDWSLNILSLSQASESDTTQADYPANIMVSANTTASTILRYVVTGTTISGKETLVGRAADLAISSIDYTKEALEITTTLSHGLIEGDEIIVFFVGSGGATEIDGQRFLVSITTSTIVALYTHFWDPILPANVSPYVSGGFITPLFVEVTDSEAISGGGSPMDNDITWNIRQGTDFYSVYRESGNKGSRIYHWIGDTRSDILNDSGITASVTKFPPEFRNPFLNGNNPGAVGFYQQRLVMGGSNNFPDTSYYSRTGRYEDYGIKFPLQDNDAITASLPELEVNRIRHFVPLKDLIIFTSGGEWVVNRGFTSAFGPNTINQITESTWGSSNLPPEVVGNTIIFLTPNEIEVRAMKLIEDFYVNNSLVTISKHLLEDRSIVDWTFVRFPDSRLYMAVSNGWGLTLSYNEEQELIAWTRFDTDGEFKRAEKLIDGGILEQDSI